MRFFSKADPKPGISRGFSLVELLVVVALLGIMTALVLPAFQSVGTAQNVTRGGQLVADQIVLGRQLAASKNREIEVRFVTLSDEGPPAFRAVQLWMADESGENPAPVSRLEKLPQGILVSPEAELSPLLDADSAVAGSADFPGVGTLEYRGFRISASGVLGTGVTTTNNFLTINSARDTNSPPANFFTLRVNPVTGRLTEYRRE